MNKKENQLIVEINGKKFYPSDERKLLQILLNKEYYKRNQFAEIWISTNKEDSPSICTLINNERASLMYLRFIGDAGYSARDQIQNDNVMIEFYLNNGQLDKYNITQTIPISDALNALEYFYTNQDMDPRIIWQDDSK